MLCQPGQVTVWVGRGHDSCTILGDETANFLPETRGRSIKEDWTMKKFLAALFAGMALEYFLDPKRGTDRRSMITKGVGPVTGSMSGVAGPLKGMMPGRHDNDNPDNVTLKDRVESEVLRDPKFGRAPINFNVEEDGVVVIHGELPTQADIDELVSRVSSVRNVKRVENLLHLPGTPAPNKLSAIEAS
jgi:hypothetical protein